MGGVNYSKIICVDPAKQCAIQPSIPYAVYSKNIKDKSPEQVRDYVCGGKPGNSYQCCDPYDPAANEIVKDGRLIKVIRDKDGFYQEFHVCTCDNQKCEEEHCKGFKRPTQYEYCRARAPNKDHEIQVSPNVYKVVAANTYTNCYQQCKP